MTNKRVRLILKELREARGLSQKTLAERVGVRQATISDLETGKSQRIAFLLLEKIGRVLNVDPKNLFG